MLVNITFMKAEEASEQIHKLLYPSYGNILSFFPRNSASNEKRPSLIYAFKANFKDKVKSLTTGKFHRYIEKLNTIEIRRIIQELKTTKGINPSKGSGPQ